MDRGSCEQPNRDKSHDVLYFKEDLINILEDPMTDRKGLLKKKN